MEDETHEMTLNMQRETRSDELEDLVFPTVFYLLSFQLTIPIWEISHVTLEQLPKNRKNREKFISRSKKKSALRVM